MKQDKNFNNDSNQAIDNTAVSFEERLAYDKLTFFYLSLPITLIGQMFGALLLSALQLESVDLYSIGIWLLLSFVMFLYRFYHYYVFRHESEYHKLKDARLWLHRYYTNVMISGIVWGSSAVLMFPAENLINQMVVLLFLFAISFTSMGVLASKRDLLLGFVLVTFLPLILRLFFLDGGIYNNIAYVVIALMLIMVLIANYYGRVINNSLNNHQHFITIKHSHDKLKERFFSLFERAPVGIYYYNTSLILQDVNTQFKHMNRVEYTKDLIGQDLYVLKNRDIIDVHENVFRNQTGNYRGPFETLYGEDVIYVDLSTVPMLDSDGEVTGGIAIINDITDEVTAKEEMVRNAYYDMLTEIPNRTLLMDKLNTLIAKDTVQVHYAALLFIDIDNFKKVNDTFGHNVGDTVLKQVAYKIEEVIGENETIARIGGDKFVVLLPSLGMDEDHAKHEASEHALSIKGSFVRPLKTAGEDYHLSLSIGIVLFNNTDTAAFDILKRSETAMYEAKKSGRNTIKLYHSVMGVHAQEQLTIENDIHKALKNGEFQIYYQPQLDVQSNKIIGAEALIRWFHPEKGSISPDKFIGVAEESGVIIKLEEWIFDQALREIKAMSEGQDGFPLRHIAINVSATHFLQPYFVERFMLLVNKHQVQPEWIELELTESEIMRNIHDAIRKIEELKHFGITFSIDDFGTGYSSFAYLKQLPVDVIKIDQAFVLNMDQNQGDAMIVESVVAIGQKFNLKILAEGVENLEALNHLKQIKCDIYQGYYAYKPMPMSEFERIVTTTSV
ncbi:MAG: bifunctional diguanylate cyclase/phosphodiesterase [Campylobacterota bacterium]|nr:bifunctional diguanylate cyclase/phosphodiesterase [Campylobacterota bacterium]